MSSEKLVSSLAPKSVRSALQCFATRNFDQNPATGWSLFLAGWSLFLAGGSLFLDGWNLFLAGWSVFLAGWSLFPAGCSCKV